MAVPQLRQTLALQFRYTSLSEQAESDHWIARVDFLAFLAFIGFPAFIAFMDSSALLREAWA